MNTFVGERAVYIYSSQVLIFSVCTTAAQQHHIENISSPRLFKAKVKKTNKKPWAYIALAFSGDFSYNILSINIAQHCSKKCFSCKHWL